MTESQDDWVTRWLSHRMTESPDDWVTRWLSHRMTESPDDWVTGWLSHWMTEPLDDWLQTRTDTYWHLLTLTDIYWCLLTLTDAYWHLLTPNDTNRHILTTNHYYKTKFTKVDKNKKENKTTNSETKKRSCYERLISFAAKKKTFIAATCIRTRVAWVTVHYTYYHTMAHRYFLASCYVYMW